MNAFEQLKILYGQFFNLAQELKDLVDSENYEECLIRLSYKDELMEKFEVFKKNVELSEEQLREIKELDEKLIETEKENLIMVQKIFSQIESELFKTNKQIKVNSAYSPTEKINGSMLDFSE